MADFNDMDDIAAHLDGMAKRQPSLVCHIASATGQRESRYAHTLCGAVENTAPVRTVAAKALPATNLEKRVIALEEKVAALCAMLNHTTNGNAD